MITETGLSYGPSPMNSADLFLPPEPSTAPVVVFIHGGAWISGQKEDLKPMARAFARRGFPTASVDYRLSGDNDVRYPMHVNDVATSTARIVSEVRAHGFRPAQLVFVGHSAGAFIAAHISLSTSTNVGVPITGVVGIAGIYDLPALVEKFPNYRSWFIEPAFGSDPAAWEDASPINHVRKTKKRWLLIHSPNDQLVRPRQSERFAERLKAAGSPVELVTNVRGSHFGVMLDLARDGSPLQQRVEAFIRQ